MNQKSKIPSLEDLHPFTASPIHNFLKDIISIDVNEWLLANNYSLKNIRFYSKKEINKDGNWKDIAPLPAIGFVLDEAKEKNMLSFLETGSLTTFNPRFRIVLPRKRREMQIIRYS